MYIGEIIKKYRNDNNVSQRTFAARTSLSPSYINTLEKMFNPKNNKPYSVTTDAAVEKHVPAVEVEGNVVKVKVGEVEHPMVPEHFIGWIAIKTTKGEQKKFLQAGEKPEAVFVLAEGEELIETYEYCNLHGLWKK